MDDKPADNKSLSVKIRKKVWRINACIKQNKYPVQEILMKKKVLDKLQKCLDDLC